MHAKTNERQGVPGRSRSESTSVSESTLGLTIIWVGFPVGGALAGWIILNLADWIFRIPFLPLPGWLVPVTELVSRGPYPALVAVALGAAAGLILSILSSTELLTVTVNDDAVSLTRGDTTQLVPGEGLGVAFLDRGHLNILGQKGEELAREPCDLDAGRLEAAFRAHGYTWVASDPYGPQFRRWVPELPELSATADALFKARQAAIEGDDQDDAGELRSELGSIGIVVRDNDDHQYFRLVDMSESSRSIS